MFSVFFLLLYGVVTYGFVFMAQQSLNLAADEAVRTALRWQQGQGAMQARAAAALAVANDRASWLGAMGAAVPAVAVCGPAGALSAAGGGACSGRTLAADQFEVVVSYAYGAHPLIPTLPGMGTAVPALLSARATARLGNGQVIAQGSS
ncbi:TadE/TadG family type IV pilus assembly protein [Achromobacter aloeverae]|uniref:TadE/TadG family type IV pilus assembly protein n=1 Tax=Achromobacter aloeverae TaxID=1750518 RepID=UPI0018641280|nr:TadE family protein [Achromobacter aloeverae]